jgi:hypothetical protein
VPLAARTAADQYRLGILLEPPTYDPEVVGGHVAVAIDQRDVPEPIGNALRCKDVSQAQSLAAPLDVPYEIDAREPFDDGGGAVRGAVVDDEHILWRDACREDAVHAAGDQLLLVEGGNHHAEIAW